MEKIKNYMSFVEIKTKLATLIPFLTGASYALYASGASVNRRIDFAATLLLIVTMFPFDMAVTAINNHIGKRASKVKEHYSEKKSIAIISVLIAVSTVLGIYMTCKYGVVILLVGLICYAAGIFYTFGPLPIANSAYGELVSGTVQGFLVTFLAAYVSLPRDYFLDISWALTQHSNGGLFDVIPTPDIAVTLNSAPLIKLVIVCIPPMCCIANIMLANNICDVDEDVAVRRYTLPYYWGASRSLGLFKALYIIAALSVIFACVTRVLPWICLLSLLTWIPVRKNIAAFREKQSKPETFALAVTNFIMICGSNALLIFLGCLF